MDYRLIKENFDKATAGVEEAEPGAPRFRSRREGKVFTGLNVTEKEQSERHGYRR
jgi:hypothetical protein